MLGYAIIGCGYVSGRHVEAAVNLPNTGRTCIGI